MKKRFLHKTGSHLLWLAYAAATLFLLQLMGLRSPWPSVEWYWAVVGVTFLWVPAYLFYHLSKQEVRLDRDMYLMTMAFSVIGSIFWLPLLFLFLVVWLNPTEPKQEQQLKLFNGSPEPS